MGGSSALIDDLLQDPGLETWPVGPYDSLQHDADRINPMRPDRGRR